MRFNYPICLIGLALTALACGHDDGSAGEETIQGLKIDGAGARGVVIASTSVDASIKASRVYYYEFASGLVRSLGATESSNPAVFWAAGQVHLFNRQAGAINYRAFDPRADAGAFPEATPLAGVAAGDPWAVAPVASGELLLASYAGKKLQRLTTATGETADIDAAPIGAELRPTSVVGSGNAFYVLSSGLASDEAADGTQKLYTLQRDATGVISFKDADASTPGVDGQGLSASFPGGVYRFTGDSGLIVGLCPPKVEGCIAGYDRLDAGKVAAGGALDATKLKYRLTNQVETGPSASEVFAQVDVDDKDHQVIRLNVATGTATKIAALPDGRLYGLAFETTSRTLLMGGVNGVKGSLSLYRDDKLVGSFDVDGVPYSMAFVPSL
jgi:hypothetical protein